MSQKHADAAVVYHVRLKNPGAHLFEVVTQIATPDAEGQVFSLPAWIPGSYLIRDYARHIVRLEAEAEGEAIRVRKLDKATWRTGPVAGPLILRAEIYAHDLSVRGAFLDFGHAFFNGVCLFFRIHGAEHERSVVHIDGPEHETASAWLLATSLRRLTGTAYEFGAFEARSYEDLIDHPALMGELAVVDFQVAGVPHAVAVAGRHDADLERLRQDLQILCTSHVEFFSASPPMDRYLFLVTVLPKGYGGLEHRCSSALICGYDDLPRPGEVEVTATYRRFLGLASHEYFHLWNVKRVRPAPVAESALDREAYTRQLWVFEGITSYYDDLGLLRSGLISVESYLELVGRSLTKVYRSRGRRRQTLEEASYDAWIKFYKPDENSPNALVSYYSKGAMVALALDLELRLKSGGSCSLDQIMAALWREHGETGYPLPEQGFEQLAEEVSGLDLGEFFRQCLRSTVDPPVGILLAQFGVRLHLRAPESGRDAGGKPRAQNAPQRPWLGVQTEQQAGRVLIKHVLADGPAMAAGLCAGDELVALNGWRVLAGGPETILGRLSVDDEVSVHVFRRDELHQAWLRPMLPPRDTCWLTLATDADESALERRRQWLGS